MSTTIQEVPTGIFALDTVHSSIGFGVKYNIGTFRTTFDRVDAQLANGVLTGTAHVDLSKVFIVSHVDFLPADDAVADVVEIDGVGRVGITTTPARGRKCGRCWLYREEVAKDGDLCERCERVVATLAPAEAPTV